MRVIEAAQAGCGGPVHLVLRGPLRADALADDLAEQVLRRSADGLEVCAPRSALDAAAQRSLPPDEAAVLRAEVDAAIGAWHGPPADVPTQPAPLPTSQRPVVMAILNVTPDSFSDGGRFLRPGQGPEPAIAAGLELVAAGAQLVDVGGESTRPGAEPVSVEEELRRVVPVVAGLHAAGVAVSVDTTKAAVAAAAVEAGAVLVNDVAAGSFDAAMLPTVAALGVPYVLMHLRGTPRTMQTDPRYDDVTAEVFASLAARIDAAVTAGIPRSHLVVDPGLGFGKTLAHNLTLLRRLRELTSLGAPVLVGASRKSFLGTLTGVEDPRDRVEASLAAAVLAVAQGAAILRVHDVAATVRALAVAAAVTRPA